MAFDREVARIVGPKLRTFMGCWTGLCNIAEVDITRVRLLNEITQEASPENLLALSEEFTAGCERIQSSFSRPPSKT